VGSAPADARKLVERIHGRVPNAPPLPKATKAKAKPKLKAVPAKIRKLADAMHERARLRQDESEEKRLPKPTIESRGDGFVIKAGFADEQAVTEKSVDTLIRRVQEEIDATGVLLAKAREAAELMTAIKKKEWALAGKPWQDKRVFDDHPEAATVYRLPKLIEVFILGKGGYMVKRETGAVCKYRGRESNPGATKYPSLDELITDLKAELAALSSGGRTGRRAARS
jgi:hypothetical protein